MKKLLSQTIILLLIFTVFSCQDSSSANSSEPGTDPQVTENENPLEKNETIENKDPVVKASPAVVLRDDASVWDNNDGALSDQPLASLDMGTEVLYLGVDADLSSGSKSYRYSKIQLDDGTIGWISATRLAVNSIAAVVVEEKGLYSKPLVTAPISRFVPAGQIVAVSQNKGIVGGFVEIRFSYYDGNSISNPETRYIEYDALSVSNNDMDAAKLVLKAFRNPELSTDFFTLTLSLGSIFQTYGTFKSSPEVYREPNFESETAMATDEIKLLAINPLEHGESMPWYLGQLADSSLVWVYSNSVEIHPSLSEKLADKVTIKDHSNYTGSGQASVNLFQGLALREKVKDDKGADILAANTSLENGEIVYYNGETFTYNSIDYLSLELPDGTAGWASGNYIAVDAKPAVITEDEIPVFTEAKLTALSKVKLNKYQVIAIHNEEISGFLKISCISQEDNTLYKEVFIRSSNASYSTKKNDVNAALLLKKLLSAEDPETVELYLRKTAEIESFFRDDLGNIYYQDVIPGDSETLSE